MQGGVRNPNRIKQARDLFFEKGSLPNGLIANPIERSWQRCLGSGLAADSRPNLEPLSSTAMRQFREKHGALISKAQPVMENLYEQILNTRSMVILTDANGLILHSLGDQDFVAKAQRVALQPGVSWDETNKGTNAIGTALAERAPILVHGAEHYIASNQFLTCSAAPICSPQGELVGALDVSGDYRSVQQHTLALVRMSVQMIENHLFVEAFPSGVSVHFHSRPEFIGTLCEGIAVFDQDGRFMSANRSGQFQLGLNLDSLRERTFSSLFDLPFDAVFSAAACSGPGLALYMHNGVRVHARLQLGAMLLGKRSVVKPQSGYFGERKTATPLERLCLGDPQVADAVARARKVLGRDIPILIQGETGTGKEIFAKAVHHDSPRRNAAFIAVNCAAIPDGLIESELFGYEEGAFTGARRKGGVGKILQANGGTLFLDEIGDMPMNLQARLLRVLQERAVTPLGSVKSYPVNVALICATNHKLREKIAEGSFREDLYYRLNGLVLRLPPLRERSDLEALIGHLVRMESGNSRVSIDAEAMALFKRHPWPGNIRQLHNVIRTAVAMVDADAVIGRPHLSDDFMEELEVESEITTERNGVGECFGSLETMEANAIANAIRAHDGNISAAARQLGVSRNTLYRKMKR